MRFLILVLLGYILYRVVRKYISITQRGEQTRGEGPVDEMVQDPACKTYIPRRDALRRVMGGKEFFFCSRECADRFEREMRARQ
ncbi:MAG: YHS domain-containing protein [Deltaproteobacteria bacterium]|nr:YHS domain-containing protein [Deltaproteobacteria bacterium]MBW2049466.1 YHS domain-containing protein [Deltaproteobacteria bacterium]MBW2110901.1 YHS domain-containing protein [Deltaproteobacteria bacterium]MBW2354184.1 YHS domain-containing protein [Deltaproteobacteria bacterium]HDZ91587.1 YHS domain-containing protein [Deltaproteobacteria bacterium]